MTYIMRNFSQCFRKLGFSYDLYTKTSSSAHKDFVSKFHKKLYESPYVYEKEVPQAYCECCHAFLADRFVEGLCPVCGKSARGDQCDECGAVLEAENLQQPVCAVCGSAVSFRSSRHLFIAITRLKDRLQELVDTHAKLEEKTRRQFFQAVSRRRSARPGADAGSGMGHRCAEGGL